MPHRDRFGELLPNGFYVGDLVTYDTAQSGNLGVVVYDTNPAQVWATYAGEGGGEERALDQFNRDGRRTWMATHRTQLVRRYNGDVTQEGSASMSAEAQGTWESITTEPIPPGTRFRFYHETDPIVEENFAYEGTMIDWSRRTFRLDVSRTYGVHRQGDEVTVDCHTYQLGSYRVWTPAATPTDSAHDGTAGAFLPHDGQMPEPGAIVRGFAVSDGRRQVEGLFLSADPISGTAVLERKRRRNKRDGSFGEWETYSSNGRTTVNIEGAEVFKAGAATQPTLVRQGAIDRSTTARAVLVGQIMSAPTEYDPEIVYRGVVTAGGSTGPFIITATEKASVARRARTGAYAWEKIPDQPITVYATFSFGESGYDNAAWIWELVGPGIKRVDPAYDPNRKTTHTGLKIGDLVVGLMINARGGRDSVASWVKGEIIKWDTRYNRPIVKVTDKMESDRKVDSEVTLESDDVYPAMADPAGVSPEEYKKTLRLYLIGRHKRGDFCRGGLNTMLAAHGIPLYETRRRAVMTITVDYDPNTTDLYTVQSSLRAQLPGVSGLSFAERSGDDIELGVESDVTNG